MRRVLSGLALVLLVCACVTRGLREHDLGELGLPALVVEEDQRLNWPELAALGRDVRIDPPTTLGAAVLLYSPQRVGAEERARVLARWISGGARLKPERVFLLSTEDHRPRELVTTIARAATIADQDGALLLVFIGYAASDPKARAERFYLTEHSFITQGDVIDAALLGPRRLRTVAIWDGCWNPSWPMPKGWHPGLHPRTYTTTSQGTQRRARITSISAGEARRCVDELPGGGGPSISYLALGGLLGWADADGDATIGGTELGTFLQSWTRTVVSERDVVAARSSSDAESGGAAAFVAVRRNWHTKNTTSQAPTMAALVGTDAELSREAQHRWAGGAVIAPPSISAKLRELADGIPALEHAVASTEARELMPHEVADLWCSPELSELPDVAWECSRRRAYANRWERFLPVLDADAAMLRDVLVKASWLGARARRKGRDLGTTFLATYREYAQHPKVRAMRAALAASRRREQRRIAKRGPMLGVPAGSFEMGCSGGAAICEPDETPIRDVHISEFAIQEYEVTLQDYELCVRSGICPRRQSDECYAYDSEVGFARGRSSGQRDADLPATCVTWDQAAAYCHWIGGRLPTEAEWEKAARGDGERVFPWSEPEQGTKVRSRS